MSNENRIFIDFDVSLSVYNDLVKISESEEISLDLLCSFILTDYIEFYKSQRGVCDGSDPADPEAACSAS